MRQDERFQISDDRFFLEMKDLKDDDGNDGVRFQNLVSWFVGGFAFSFCGAGVRLG